MALVNPSIAMSFKPTTEYQPRNVLADYAQLQQIQSGQMQMQDYRRKSEQLERIRTAISKAGGPNDLETASLEMMKVPEYFEQGYKIYQTIKDKKEFEDYLKGQQPVAGTPTAQTQPAAAPAGTHRALDLPQAGSGVHRPTNALDPSIIERIGLSQPPGASPRGYAPETGNAPALFTPAPTNALVRVAQSPVAQAPVNALAPALVDRRTAILNEIEQLSRFTDPRAAVRIRQLEQQLTAMEPRVVGGSVYYPDTGEFKTPTKPSSKLIRVLVNGQPTLVPEEQAVGMTPATPATMRAVSGGTRATGGARAAAVAGGKIDKVLTDETGRTRFFDKFGKEITPTSATGEPVTVQGKPSAAFEKTRATQQQLNKDMDSAVKQLTDITKEGGLIDQSTGSGIGRLVDIGAGFVGQATPGAIATAKLAPIADIVLKMVPRFEGPQSDKDTQSYKEAAGQLANPSLPSSVRKAAGLEILRLMKERKNQFVTQSMADQGIPPVPTAPNIDALLEKYK